LASR
jgi:hypothetical protein